MYNDGEDKRAREASQFFFGKIGKLKPYLVVFIAMIVAVIFRNIVL